MGVLQALSQTAFSRFVAESLWAYPVALTCHAIGMGLLVGVVCIMNLRILGFFRPIPFPGLSMWFPVILVGFLVNLISGTTLYLSDPANLVKNWAFDVKIVLVFIGMILLLAMRATPAFKNIVNMPAAAIGGTPARTVAIISLIVWLSAILSGRLTGYVTVD